MSGSILKACVDSILLVNLDSWIYRVDSGNVNVTFWCVLLVAVAFFVYAVVVFCLLWHFNVSVAPSVCCGVCLFVIAGGVSLLWRYRFVAILLGLL